MRMKHWMPALLGLCLLPPVHAAGTELAELRQAVDHAQRSLAGTSNRLALLVAEYDAGRYDAAGENPAPAAETTAPVSEQTASLPVDASVSRHQFTTDVAVREPVDRIERISPSAGRVFYFTELRGLAGHRITHRWLHEGEVMAEVSFDVRGPRWRVKSSKNLQPDWTGEWMVEVVDEQGRILARDRLQVAGADG